MAINIIYKHWSSLEYPIIVKGINKSRTYIKILYKAYHKYLLFLKTTVLRKYYPIIENETKT